MNAIHSGIKRIEAIPVPLDGVLNWKGVSWPALGIAGQIDPHGSSLPGELLPNNGLYVIRDIPFRIPRTDTEADDVISCEGQTIVLHNRCKAQSVLILGCSVFGDYMETLGLRYTEGGAFESSVFGLTDWFQYSPGKPPLFGEEEGIVMPYFLDDEGIAERPVALWIQRIPADPARSLYELQLPENPFMYIMAITLIAI